MTDNPFQLSQIVVLTMIVVLFAATTLFRFKAEHLEGSKAEAVLGAALFGLMFGLIVVLVLLPMRFEEQSGGTPSWLPFFAIIILALRSDRITSLPMVGRFLRAYRVATLRRTITQSRERLDKLGVARDTESRNADE